MCYKNLEVWKLAKEITIQVHEISLDLPKFELYEEGSQIRRSSKSVRSNIVEAYARRRYKADFIKVLIYALSSNDETIDHLEILFETQSLKDKELFHELHKKLNQLGKMIHLFIKSKE